MSRSKLPLIGMGLVLALFLHTVLFAQGSPNVTLLKHIDGHHSAGYNDCWGYIAPDGREYAILGVKDGTSIVDITDAANASEVAFIPSTFSTWKDIKTYQNYAYAVNENGMGLQIIDLSNLPAFATLVATFNGFSSMHNIFIDENSGILYASPGSGSDPAIAYSLANPVAPVQLSTFGIHNHDAYARNNIVYLSEGWDGSFSIYDLSTPTSPSLLARLNIPSAGYVHNAWTTEDGNYLMTTEETNGKTVKFWNIQNLGNITLESEYLATPGGIAHNAHIKGSYAYLSHYGDGLRILDISNPSSISEIGFYDTQSAWGAWPYFNSGKILISDIQNGLYVVFFDGAVINPTAIGDAPEVPQEFYVSANYPNPFNPSTTINYQLTQSSPVNLSIYNSLGQKVRTLVNGVVQPGSHQAVWDGRNDAGETVGSGMYLYLFKADNFSKTHKMILMK